MAGSTMMPHIGTGIGSESMALRVREMNRFRQGLSGGARYQLGSCFVVQMCPKCGTNCLSNVSPDIEPHPANVGRPKRWEFSSSKTGGEDVYCVPSSSSSSSFGRHVLCPISREVQTVNKRSVGRSAAASDVAVLSVPLAMLRLRHTSVHRS